MKIPGLMCLKVDEAAALLRVSPSRVLELIEGGQLLAAFPDGREEARIPACSLAALFDRKTA